MNDRTSHPSTHSISSWAFDLDQHALKVLDNADPTFAKAMTRKLVPDRDPPEVLRRTINGRVVVQRRGGR